MVIFDNSRTTDRLPEDWKGESIVSTFEKGVTGGIKSPRVFFFFFSFDFWNKVATNIQSICKHMKGNEERS